MLHPGQPFNPQIYMYICVYTPPHVSETLITNIAPKYMPLTIFNRSKVNHLYIGKDTVIAFAEQPTIETYNIQLASDDAIKEHLAKPHK